MRVADQIAHAIPASNIAPHAPRQAGATKRPAASRPPTIKPGGAVDPEFRGSVPPFQTRRVARAAGAEVPNGIARQDAPITTPGTA
jgi:hypothetical protein